MKNENGQLEIPDRQLQASYTQSKASVWTEIGEAQITHTIFGKAKVRIIRKHDNTRRALMLTAMVATAIAVVAWQGWFASQQTEPSQSADLPAAGSEKVQMSAPAFQPENIAPAAVTPSVKSEPATLPQAEINKPANKSTAQPPQGLTGAEKVTAKPVTAQPKPAIAQPLTLGMPQKTPPAANNNVTNNQTDTLQPPRLLPRRKPVAPATSTPLASQTPASGTAAAVTLAPPLGKEDISKSSSAGDKPAAEPVSTQGK